LVPVLSVWLSAAGAAELTTEAVVLERVAGEQRFEGVIEAVQRATVSAQTSGRIVEILFDVDDYVERGAVLLRFHAAEQEARYQQANAALEEARARLTEARNERARIAGIYARQLVAKAAMDKADAELKAAQARFESAEARLTETAEQREHTIVRAPYAGIVVERHVELGELANPGQPLMTGISLEQLRAVTGVPQRYIAAVRELVHRTGLRRGYRAHRRRIPDRLSVCRSRRAQFPGACEPAGRQPRSVSRHAGEGRLRIGHDRAPADPRPGAGAPQRSDCGLRRRSGRHGALPAGARRRGPGGWPPTDPGRPERRRTNRARSHPGRRRPQATGRRYRPMSLPDE
jgi:biotin carboxyl carrier protein